VAVKPSRPGRWERIQAAIPKHSIVGRILYPMVEERKTLAGAMAWVGLCMLFTILFIAIFADVISPYNPAIIVDEPMVPPLTNAAITKNLTSDLVDLPTRWVGGKTGLALNDGNLFVSQNVSDSAILESFGFRPFTNSIISVEVLIQSNGTTAAPDNFVDVRVSWDGGGTWSAPQRTSLRTSDLGNGTDILDFTPATRWTAASFGDTTFLVSLTHVKTSGAVEGAVSVDFLNARMTYLSGYHIMGTDGVGQDVFSRVLHGTRTSLAIMVIGVSVAFIAGFPLGLFSGYVGGNIDKVLVLVMDSLYSFPGLLMAGIIAVLLGKGVLNIGLAITVIYIPLYFRVTRSQVLSVREELYVEAAKALGAKPLHVMFAYIAYNVLIAVPVIFSISAADAILTAAGLSFLGWGIEAPTPDWGRDLSAGQGLISTGIWWPSFYPGLMILFLTVSLSFLGEGLSDIVNPLLRKERS